MATKPTKKEAVKKVAAPKEKVEKTIPAKIKALPDVTVGTGMFLFTSSFQLDKDQPARETFRGMPASKDCPYVEMFWDPFGKSLVIIGRDTTETFQVFPKLSAAGHYLMNSDKNTRATVPYQQERLKITKFNEHYMFDVSEINQFLRAIAVNQEYDWKKYLEV